MKALYIFFLFAPLFSIAQNPQLQKIIQEYQFQDSIYQTGPWRDFSAEKLSSRLEYLKSAHSKLSLLNSDSLGTSDLANKDLLELIIDDEIYQLEFESHLFPLNSEGGFLTGVLYNIRGQHIATERDFEKYQQKLQALDDYISVRRAHLESGMKAGKIMPKLIVRNCLDLINGILKGGASNSFFMDPLKGNKNWETETLLTLKTQVFPAYETLKDFLEKQYLPAAPEKIGVREMKGGKAFYEQRVRFFTTQDITPEEVYNIGMKEVGRIRKEMEAIIKALDFQGSFSEFLTFLRTDPQFYTKTPEELLKEAAWIAKRMEGKLPTYFSKLPRMPLAVVPVPASLAPNYTGGRYSPGSYKSQKPGEYWVNTYDLPSRPLYVLPALSLHEGVPGHHTQIMLAAEMENMPKFRKNTYLSAFGEGWALYTEFLGKEAGIYQNKYEDFGRLTYEMWRACRLVVDPGMHYMGWTREKAVQFMSENTALSIREVNSEIDRYIGWPGQAVSYKMGELKIRALRTMAENELGQNFDIRSFHDLILSQGSVTMKTLEKMVTDYIQKEKM